METIVPQLRRTAWHEAGHVVAAHLMGWTLGAARISPDDWSGSTEAAPPACVTLRDHLVMLHAGDLGANLSEIEAQGDDMAAARDWRKIHDELEAAFPDDNEAQVGEWRAAEKIARDLLNRHRPAVERIAEALLRSPAHALSGDQIAALLVAPTGDL
ncbi:hypothetical protein FFK22_009310 [Mycobacterium sp. KBS0706]|uniref:hypothetical protein n=1 Tax=Mycobacterium sp. KBS0706 TaxID=2578109 RepID=UPI00110FDDEF|nr:hypothetical protein [Mycobacterium sp. KBS0706]TSD88911.1 hypothetical protein FFK22_009310 [Mycobacterium sp. KBS0706]